MFTKPGLFAQSALLIGALLLASASPSLPNRISAGSAAASNLSLPAYFEPDRADGYIARTRHNSVRVTSLGAEFSVPRDLPDGRRATIAMKVLGGRRTASIGERRLKGKKHYLRGSDPKQWRRDVPLFRQVRCPEVYPGIDLVYHTDAAKDLEYDFVVTPGADPSRIALAFSGVTGACVDRQGDLVLSAGSSEFRNRRPVAYQEFDGKRRVVRADYRLSGEKQLPEVRFDLGEYDPTRPLVIDPILSYSTYLGGSAGDTFTGIALAGDGTVFVTGRTESADIPLRAPFQTDQPDRDVYVARLNPNLSGDDSLLYATVLGGSGFDQAADIEIDPSGAICIVGNTHSADFPTTPQALQPNAPPSENGFFSRLTADGAALLYSTYLGGSSTDSAVSLAINSTGKVFLTGRTSSSDFPTKTPVQPFGGIGDVFVSKVDPVLSGAASLLYSTYLGGSGSEDVQAIAVSSSGLAHVVGTTQSPDYPVSASAFDGTFSGEADGYITRLNFGGNTISYSTYFGGSGFDGANAVAVDSSNRVHLAGSSSSPDFPTTPTAFSRVFKGNSDAIYSVLDPAAAGAAQLSYSTLIGGANTDLFVGLSLDSSSKPFLLGETNSVDFPANRSFHPRRTPFDLMIVRLDPELSPSVALRYSTYLGGGAGDSAKNCVLTSAGELFVAGSTSSSDFPVTTSAFQGVFKGNQDGILARISPAFPSSPNSLQATLLSSTQIKLTWLNTTTDQTAVEVHRRTGNGNFAFLALLGPNATSFTDSGLGQNSFTYKLRATNSEGPSAFSNEATGSTLIPTAPTGVTALTSGSLVVLRWTDSANETSYEVLRKLSGQGFFAKVGTLGANVTEFAEITANNRTFIYIIRAVNAIGIANSSQVPVTTLAAPTNLTVQNNSGTTNSLNLQWTDNSLNLESGFVIQRKLVGGTFNNVREVGPNITPAVDTGLSPNTEYVYRVQAKNGNGRSGFSNQATGKTARIPAAPSSVTARALSGTQVRVRWQDNSLFEVGFRIERSAKGKAFQEAGRVGKDGEEFLDGGLAPRTDYTYRVFAFNGGGDSPASNEAEVRTLKEPQGRLSVAEVVTFPATPVAGVSTALLLLRNLSPRDSLLVLIEPPAAPFSAPGSKRRRMAPGASSSIRLRFSPQTPGQQFGTLVLRSSDPRRSEVRIRLSGNTR